MVEFQDSTLDSLFHALGDATRRRMLQNLAAGERTVGQLAEPFAMSLAAASKHVKTLEAAGLIEREIQGRQHLCRLQAAPLAAAQQWLSHYERFWTARLDRLEALLRQPETPASAAIPTPRARATPKPSGPARRPPRDAPRRPKTPRRPR